MRNPKFKSAHLWLLFPLVIFLWGFYYSYWSKFSEVLFRRHVHSLTATLWIVILTAQPWIYNHRSIAVHRKVGFVGLFLAGGVVFTSLALLPFNGPFYGITFSNLLQLIGFSTAVILAMLHSRNYKKHGRWMISTIFWILPPATSRLLAATVDGLNGWYASLFIAVIPLMILIYLDYRKEKVVYRAYLYPLIMSFPIILLNPVMQETQWWIDFCQSVIGQGGVSES